MIDGGPRLCGPSAGLVRMNIGSIKNLGIRCNPSNTSYKSYDARIRNSAIVGHDPDLVRVLPPNAGETEAVPMNDIIIVVLRRTKATVIAGDPSRPLVKTFCQAYGHEVRGIHDPQEHLRDFQPDGLRWGGCATAKVGETWCDIVPQGVKVVNRRRNLQKVGGGVSHDHTTRASYFHCSVSRSTLSTLSINLPLPYTPLISSST
ncbi:hypothetical protein PIB30_072468 [Stylosanthes scabra]|uniref:Uncharacterized protein n=1 Tax=Stylosanthes scabra TaxID=79078 RepID=A0ABU6QNM7_9FABA|nr:hypothetical protein [Stylosanthes scabra]